MRDVAEEVINSLVINSDDTSDTLINKLQEIVAWLDGAQEGETLGDILDDIGELRIQLWGEDKDHASLDTVGGALRDIGTLQTNVNNLNSGLETLTNTVHEQPSTLTSGNYGPASNAAPGYGQTFTVPYVTVDARGRVTAAANKTITIPASDNTDTKVTAVGNHYAPMADSNAALSVDASSTTAATWNSTSLVTGVNLQRDAKGHVTGVTVDSIKMPANPNTDTHHTAKLIVGTNTGTANAATSNGGTYVNLIENSAIRSSTKIVGSGATKVTSDANGIITISSTDNNTVYTHPSYTARTGVPTANATLSHGGTFTVTQPVCDATGHITALNTRTYTLPADNNTDTKVTTAAQSSATIYVTGCTGATTGTLQYNTNVKITDNALFGAAWNDYAEFRESDILEPGRVICENGDDTLSLASERLQPGAEIVSDTFGFIIGVSIPKGTDPMEITFEQAVIMMHRKHVEESERHLKTFSEDAEMEVAPTSHRQVFRL